MEQYLKWFRLIDFVTGVGSLSYGSWLFYREGLTHSAWPIIWLAGGILGLALAYINLGERLWRAINSKLVYAQDTIAEDPGFPPPPLEPYVPPR